MRRTIEKMVIDRDIIKKIVLDNFSDKDFVLSDVYYMLHKTKTKSSMTSMFNDFRALVLSKFLSYRIKKRRAGINQGNKFGAVYRLNKKELIENGH